MARLTRRWRRLIVAGTVLIAFTAAISSVMYLRQASVNALVAQARTDGLDAYQRGDYARALDNLSFYVTHERRDTEILLAFADTRAKLPLENNRHLIEAAGLYRAAVDLEPDNTRALAKLMHLYERLNRRVEWLDIAERILARDPHNVEALRAQASAHYLQGDLLAAAQVCDELIALEPEELTWRIFALQIMQDRGESFEDVLQQCRQWRHEHEPDGRYQMIKAQLHAAAGGMREARHYATAAAERGATSPQVLHHLLALLDVLGLDDYTHSVIERARAHAPNEQWVYEASVHRLWKTGDLAGALDELQRMTAEHDKLGRGLLRWKSVLLAMSNDHDHAMRTIEQLERIAEGGHDEQSSRERAWAKAASARVALQSGNWSGAIAAYREAVALAPGDAVVHFMMGDAYTRVDEHHLAAQSFNHALRHEPGWAIAQQKYARTLLRLGRYGEAADVAVRQIQRNTRPDVEICAILATAWMHGGLSAEEVGLRDQTTGSLVPLKAFLTHVHRSVPNHAEIATLLVAAHLRDGERDAAVQLIDSIIHAESLDRHSVIALVKLSDAYELGLESVILQRASDALENDADIDVLRARLAHQAGRPEQAMEIIDQAAGSRGEAAYRRAAYLAWARDPAAVQAMQDVLDHASNDPAAITFVLSQKLAWGEQQLIDDAITKLQTILGESAPRVALARAAYFLRFEPQRPASLARAMMLVSQVLHSVPDSLNAMRLMTMLHLAGDQPDYDAAIRQLERAVQAHPRRLDLYPQLISLLQRQGDFLSAEEHLGKMGRLVGTNTAARSTHLWLLEAQGDFDEVIARLSHQISSHDDVAEQLVFAASLHRTGNASAAEDLFEALLESHHDAPAVLSAAANFFMDTGRHDRAWTLLQTYESETGNGVAAMLLGSLYERSGDAAEAGHWYASAVQRAPERPETWLHYARHLLAQGNNEEARRIASKALQIDPDDVAILTVYAIASIHLGGAARREALRELELADCGAEAVLATLKLYDRVVRAQRSNGLDEQLLSDLEQLAHSHPGYHGAWRLAISSHAQAGQAGEAALLARQAASRLPAQAEFPRLATLLHLQAGEMTEALETAGIWRQRSLQKPLHADSVIAAIRLDLEQPRLAADQLAPHVERIITERATSPERLAVLLHAFVADRRFAKLSTIMDPIRDDDHRWSDLLIELAEHADEDSAAKLREIAEPALQVDTTGWGS